MSPAVSDEATEPPQPLTRRERSSPTWSTLLG
jgi:hypothetical protein